MAKEFKVGDEIYSNEIGYGKVTRVFGDVYLEPPTFVYEVQEHCPKTNKYDGTKYLLYSDDLTHAADAEVDPTIE